jgi:tetratricopeptide (TPR) repeat protein
VFWFLRVRASLSPLRISESGILKNRFLLFCAVLSLAAPCAADVVKLSGGREIRGVVQKPDADPVTVLTAAGNIRVSRSRIEKIEKESEPVNLLLQAEFQVRCGNASAAERMMREAQAAGASQDSVCAWCERFAPFLQTALAPADARTRTAWVSIVRGVSGLPAPPFSARDKPSSFTLPDWTLAGDESSSPSLKENLPPPSPAANMDPGKPGKGFFLGMSRVFATAGEGAFALDLLERIDSAALKEAGPTEAFIRPLMIQQLQRILDAHDFRRASGLVENMETAGLGLGRTVRILLCLRWAAFERARGNYSAALSVLEERLKPLSPPLSRERLTATLAEARENLGQKGKYPELIEIYRQWGAALTGRSVEDTETDLCEEWGQSLLKQGKWPDARRVFEEYYKRRPPEQEAGDKRPLLDLCSFRERMAALDKKDYAGAFEVGVWAAEQGLAGEAVTAFERASEHAALRKTARERIAILRKQIALERLERCMNVYEKGNPKAALEELEGLQPPPADRDVAERFRKLRQLCAQELRRLSELRPVQASTLLQDVQRRLLLGQEEDAVRDLETIISTLGETPAARAAERLLQTLEMRRNLERLEGPAPQPLPRAPRAAPLGPDLEADREIKRLLKELESAKIVSGE